MLRNFNSPTPPGKLVEYLEENTSSEFKYRQRAVLVRNPDDTWHVVCCVVQAFSHVGGYPKREASCRYDRVLLFEGWRDAESCGQLIDDLQSGMLQFDDIILERKAKATWNSEYLSSKNPMMGKAGLVVRTRFEADQVNLTTDLLSGEKLPFYSSAEEAAREWLPFDEYHGHSDARNQEVLFLLPEFRAHITDAVWSKGVLRIAIDGSDARMGRPLFIKGSYRIGKSLRQFESPVVKTKATVRVVREANRFQYILTDVSGKIFDFRDATTELLVRGPDLFLDGSAGDGPELKGFRQLRAVEIPAADRIVRLNHNSKRYRDALESLDRLIRAVEETNDYDDTEDKEERLEELKAGRGLLKPARVRKHVVWALIGTAISGLVEKFSGGFLGEVGKVAFEAVRKLLGF